MIIKKIQLYNIRSYIDESINFSTGTNLLSGDIGCGKSSILIAMEFALFGIKKNQLPGGLLLRHGKKQGHVEINFQLENDDVIIRRTLKRSSIGIKQTEGYIIINGKKSDLMPEELRAKVFHILGYPKNDLKKSKDVIFRFTVYTPQELMKEILYENNEIRKDTIRKVFGIDKYKRIQENTETYIKTLKNRQKIAKELLLDLPEKIEQKKQYITKKTLLQKNKESINEKVQKIQLIKNKYKQKITNIEDSIQLLNKKKETYACIQSELNQLKQNFKSQKLRIISKENDLKTLVLEQNKIKIIDMDEHESELNNNLIKLIEENSKIIRDKELSIKSLNDIDNRLKTLTERKNELNKIENPAKLETDLKNIPIIDIELLNQNIASLTEEIKNLLTKISEYKTMEKNNKDIIFKINQLDNCPTCMQTVPINHKLSIITSHKNKIQKYQKELTILDQNLISKQKQLDRFSKEKEKANENIKKIEILKIQIKDSKEKQREHKEISLEIEKLSKQKSILLSKTYKTHEEKIEELKSKLQLIRINNENKQKQDKLKIKFDTIKEEIKNLHEQTQNIEKSLTIKTAELEKLKKEIENNSKILEEFNQIKTKIEETDNTLKKQEILLAEKIKEIENVDNLLKQVNLDLEKKKEIKKNQQKISTYQNWLNEYFINVISIIEKQIMSSVYTEFNELFQNWFNILVEEDSLQVRLSDEFSPIIEQNGYETDVENLSGGERQALALAYRLALNKVINDIVGHINTRDLIILDEPTDGFSSEQMDKIRDVLDQLSMTQIILVSHESKLETFVNNVIRINKSDHISQVSLS